MTARIETRGKRRRSLKRKLAYAAIPTILAFLLIEGLFRIHALVQEGVANRREYERLGHHPAYQSQRWAAPGWKGWNPPGTHLVVPKDTTDPFFTIRDGIRRTVGFDAGTLPPGRRPRKLFVLGGSTTFCEEVPDDLTWASQLQEQLAAIPETRDIEVVNCGISEAVSLQEVERLEYEIGRDNIPDFCVFLDGLNDAFQGVLNGQPGATMRDAARTYYNAVPMLTLRQIAQVSVAARTIYYWVRSSQLSNDPAHTRVDAKVRELAQATADTYERNMLRAREICDRHGIRMMVLLQPHVFSIGTPWTDHDRAAAGRMNKRRPARLLSAPAREAGPAPPAGHPGL
jgi:hypothetical protein